MEDRPQHTPILPLVILAMLTAGSPVAGVLAHNGAFWTAATTVFFMGAAALAAFSAQQLGVVADAIRLLSSIRGQGRSGNSSAT